MSDDIVESVTDAERAPFNKIGVFSGVFEDGFLQELEAFADYHGIKSQFDALLQAAKLGLQAFADHTIGDAYRDELNKPREDWQNY